MRAENHLISLSVALLLLHYTVPSMANNISETVANGSSVDNQLNHDSQSGLSSEAQLKQFEDTVAKVLTYRQELNRNELPVSDFKERQACGKQYRNSVKEAALKYRQVRSTVMQSDLTSRLERDLSEIKNHDQFLYAEISGDRTVYQELWPQPTSSQREVRRFLQDQSSVLRGFDSPGSR